MASASIETPSPRMFCGECGGSYPVQDLARFGNSYVCVNCKPAYVQRMREGVRPMGTTMAAVHYGGFWIRFLAIFIDALILGVVITPLFLMVGFGAGMFRGFDPENTAANLPNIGLFVLLEVGALVLALAYNVWFVAKKGATPGKMVLGLKVVGADGQNLTVGRAVGRYFAYMLSGFTLYIGYIMAGFDSEKRALHDHICNTRVIYK